MTPQTWEHNAGSFGAESRSDAPTEAEFESLLMAAREIEDEHERLEARTILLLAGRLGMRRGEIAHMTADWINWRDSRIQIPAHEPCEKGSSDGVCSHCRENALENQGLDPDQDDIQAFWWRPANPVAERGVPFGWSSRTELTLNRFVNEFESFRRCSDAINRRIWAAAELAPDVDADNVSAHTIRTAAILHHAGRGLGPAELQALMGWQSMMSAETHIAGSDENVSRELRRLHSQ